MVLHNHPQCQDEVVLPVEGQGELGHIAFRRLQRFHKWRGACPVMGCKPIAMERAEDMSMLLPCGRSLLRAAAQSMAFRLRSLRWSQVCSTAIKIGSRQT